MSVSISSASEIKGQELFFKKSFQSNWGARVEKTIKIHPSFQPTTFYWMSTVCQALPTAQEKQL